MFHANKLLDEFMVKNLIHSSGAFTRIDWKSQYRGGDNLNTDTQAHTYTYREAGKEEYLGELRHSHRTDKQRSQGAQGEDFRT